MQFHVYVAAPYADAPVVRAVHQHLRTFGIVPTSGWAEGAKDSVEGLASLPLSLVRALAERNDHDLYAAQAVLVLPREGAGREMYAEARLAVVAEIPVVWVGTPVCLTSFRKGVVRVADIREAFDVLLRMANARAA